MKRSVKKYISLFVTLLLLVMLITSMSACEEMTVEEKDKLQMKITDEYLKSEATCTCPAVYYYCDKDGKKTDKTFYFGEALEHTMSGDTCTVCGYKKGAPDFKGNKIIFGSYPQGEISDGELKAKLTALAGELPEYKSNKAWTSFKYYMLGSSKKDFSWYIDVDYNGEKYRGIYFEMARPSQTCQDGANTQNIRNKYDYMTIYWFRYEPVIWNVLETDGETAFVISEKVLDCTNFAVSASVKKSGEDMIYPNNYENSYIRKWLNETMINTLFTENDISEYILDTTVDNSEASTYPFTGKDEFFAGDNVYWCNDTTDKLFLLSEKEVTDPKYGFMDWWEYDPARSKAGTDYTKSQGSIIIDAGQYEGNTCWWLRSPDYEDQAYSYAVYEYGLAYHFFYTLSTRMGVAPAMRIRIK